MHHGRNYPLVGLSRTKRPARRFKHALCAETRLNDLTSAELCQLAEPSERNNAFFYDFILAVLGHNPSASFDSVDNHVRLKVVDIHLFMADHIRFEMMSRLGWLSRFCATQYPLVEMVRRYDHIRKLCQQDPPVLSETHPGYPAYMGMVDRDQQVYIRRMLPSALEEFRKRLPQ